MEQKSAGAAIEQAARMLGRGTADAFVRQAARIVRCVSRGAHIPLQAADLAALAEAVRPRSLADGEVAFRAGAASDGV